MEVVQVDLLQSKILFRLHVTLFCDWAAKDEGNRLR